MGHLPPPAFVLHSKSFLIRRLTRDDASPALEAWIDDDNSAAMLNTQRRSWTVAEQASYFAKQEANPRKFILGIFPAEAKAPIGLFAVNLKPRQGVFTISLIIGDKSWRGRGVSHEASIGIFDYFFDKLGFYKAKANVRPDNKAMQWLLRIGGWRQEALLRKHLRLKASGERGDLYIFGILADEWRATRDSPNFMAKRKQSRPEPAEKP
jgi:RimJ/RimL family protein N-acetyltransferase